MFGSLSSLDFSIPSFQIFSPLCLYLRLYLPDAKKKRIARMLLKLCFGSLNCIFKSLNKTHYDHPIKLK